MTAAFDIFAIARNVTRAWLPDDTDNAQADVLRALAAPQDGGKGKNHRRLNVGWFIASRSGGWHRLDAVPRRSLPGLQRATRIEAVIGAETIREPLVVVKLAKAGLKPTDFAISYGDQLRIGEAGKGITLIDLRRVRAVLPLLQSKGKPSGKALYDAKRSIVEARLAVSPSPIPVEVAAAADTATGVEIRYAVAVATVEYERRKAM
jgi:hypothetical protein